MAATRNYLRMKLSVCVFIDISDKGWMIPDFRYCLHRSPQLLSQIPRFGGIGKRKKRGL